jgi:iron complex outermembrane receptor protein
MRKSRTLALLATGASMALVWQGSTAMGASSDNGAPEQIVVTARRTQERLQKVPISISVLNQRQLTDRNISSAEDLAKSLPSLSFNSQFGSDNTTFSLRGFTQDIGTSPTVGIFFADVVAPRGGITGSLEAAGNGSGPGSFFDLQNVQVLKGPQGTLFGRNTTGGDILLVPQKPNGQFGGYFETSFGNYGMVRTQGAVNVPVNDRVKLRVSFDQEKRDGYLHNISGVGPSNFDDIDYVAGRVSLVIDPTDDIENYTIASISNSNTNGPISKIIACNPALTTGLAPVLGPASCAQIKRDQGPYTVESGLPDANSYDRVWQIINRTSWQVSDNLSLTNIASYSQLQNTLASSLFGDNFAFPSKFFGLPTGSLAGKHLYFYVSDSPNGEYGSDQQTTTEEFQVHGTNLDDRLDWQVGAYMEYSFPIALAGIQSPTAAECTDYKTYQCTDPIYQTIYNLSPALAKAEFEQFGPGGLPGDVHDYLGTIIYHNYALYGQANYKISDTFKLTVGFRETDDITSGTFDLTRYKFLTPDVPTPVCAIPDSQVNCSKSLKVSSTAPTGVVDLDWSPTQDFLGYVKYSRGYRQGGLTPTGPADAVIGTRYLTYQPEQVDAYEIGMKNSFHGAVSGTLDMAAFYNNLTNQQVETTFLAVSGGAASTPAIVNLGTSRIYGLELDSTLRLTPDFALNASYTYLNTEVESVMGLVLAPGSIFTPQIGAAPGKVLEYSPHSKVSVTGTYHLPLPEHIGNITLGSTLTYTGSQAVNPLQPGGYLPDYTLVNFNVNWERAFNRPLDLEFFMTNALDRHYYTYYWLLASQLGFNAADVGEPRIYGVRLRVHF